MKNQAITATKSRIQIHREYKAPKPGSHSQVIRQPLRKGGGELLHAANGREYPKQRECDARVLGPVAYHTNRRAGNRSILKVTMVRVRAEHQRKMIARGAAVNARYRRARLRDR